MTDSRTVLVLCTGNSARSQMAEGFLRHHGADLGVHALSAGTEPAPRVHPLAIRAMAEKDIDISDHRPEHVDVHEGKAIDVLITVCDSAAEACPIGLYGAGERLSWSFPDPAAADGDEAARLAVFREIRDRIEARIRAWLGVEEEVSV